MRRRPRFKRMIGATAVLFTVTAPVAVYVTSSGASILARSPVKGTADATRYSLAHGCYTLRSPAGGRAIARASGPFRMQAAALGIYLIYGRRRDYLIDTS